MRCEEARNYWNLYHDSEGDPALHFQVGEHLALCPGCAEWFAKQSRLEALLAEQLRTPGPTPEQWEGIHLRVGLKTPEPSRRWLWLSGFAGIAAAVVLLLGWSRPFAAAPDLAGLTAECHAQLAGGRQAVEFVNGSDHEVERYLRRRVPFPVRCPPRKDAGFAVQGAGICKLARQPTAYLVGEVDRTPVSIFILSRNSLHAFPHQQEAVRHEARHRCREGPYEMVLGLLDQNVVVVIGQTDPGRLERVLNAYGAYPHHEGS